MCPCLLSMFTWLKFAAFEKVFLRVAPCRILRGALTGIRQTLPPSPAQASTPRERQRGGDWTPRKNSGQFWKGHVCPRRTYILCLASALALFPTCSLSAVLGGQAQHTLGFRLGQLVWESGDLCQAEQRERLGEGVWIRVSGVVVLMSDRMRWACLPSCH